MATEEQIQQRKRLIVSNNKDFEPFFQYLMNEGFFNVTVTLQKQTAILSKTEKRTTKDIKKTD